jgi:hypothetical protein
LYCCTNPFTISPASDGVSSEYAGQVVRYVSQNPLLTNTLPSLTGAPVSVGVLPGEVTADCTVCR